MLPLTLLALTLACPRLPTPQQEYRSSVTGTDFDFITDADPSTFLCLEFQGKRLREMPDKVERGELVQPALVFMAYYEDGTSVDIALDADFATEEAAREEALRYAARLGKLPTTLRGGVKRIVVHAGPTDATAFSDKGLIVLYSANATKRIATHDLEETLFHESVHAAWDSRLRESEGWLAAQKSDGTFLTAYAAKNPDGEDLAESALFAYTLVHHPERIPVEHAARIRAAIPARIAFVESLVPPGRPIFQTVGPRYACDGSGTTFTVVRNEESQDEKRDPAGVCTVNLARVGTLSDILSNALMRGLQQEEPKVKAFLADARKRELTAEELRDAAAREFDIDRARIDEQVLAFEHCNCTHGELGAPAARATVGPVELTSELRASVSKPELRPLLILIAVLLAGLLVVSTATLIVLAKRTRAAPGS
jgi:hypothetical protein